MLQPVVTVQLELYENAGRFLGVASVTLPSIIYVTQTISGAGLMGNIEVPVVGMVDNMTVTINWLDQNGDAAVSLMDTHSHMIDCRAVTEKWDTQAADAMLQADEYKMLIRAKSMNPGTIAPMGTSDASGEYDCYYFKGLKDGQEKWEIDKRNMICKINGVDQFAEVRTKLGL